MCLDTRSVLRRSAGMSVLRLRAMHRRLAHSKSHASLLLPHLNLRSFTGPKTVCSFLFLLHDATAANGLQRGHGVRVGR
jgi:hypothetical protein